MRLVMEEITQVNIRMHKSSDKEVLNIKDFYKTFEKRKQKYPPGYFDVNTKTKAKRKQSVSLMIFKKIIKQYLKIYFYDFYNNKLALYFPLGGWMKKVALNPFINKQQRSNKQDVLCRSDGTIAWFWFQRPSRKIFYLVDIHKLTGSTNQIPKLEAEWLSKNDKDILPIFTQETRKFRHKNMFFICTLT